MKSELFSRNVPGSLEVLQRATVAVAGCGGLGSNAAVALVRSGVGRLILADFDRVAKSNLNRQHYFLEDVGKTKVTALAAHLRRINPGVNLTLHPVKLTPANIHQFFAAADILIEAFDRGESKIWLVESWSRQYPDRPVIVGSGLSGIGHTGELRVEKSGRIFVCGDQKNGEERGLSAARVGLVAHMQANTALALLINPEGESI